MNTPPTFKETVPSERDLIQRMYSYNVSMAKLGQRSANDIGTDGLESVLENLSLILVGEYGDNENIEVPVAVLRQSAMFASIALSRILWERYKYEKTLGHKLKPTGEVIVQPTREELTPKTDGE